MTIWLAAPLFLVFLVALIFGLVRYRPSNFDRSMLFMLAICTMVLGTKAVVILYYNLHPKKFSNEVTFFQTTVNILNMIVDFTLWMMLFSFVFEMNTVADVFKSQSSDDLGRRETLSRRIRMGFMTSVFLFRLVFHSVDVAEMVMSAEAFNIHERLLLWTSFTGRIPYVLCFLFALILWFHLVTYFLSLKKLNHPDGFSCSHIFTIGLTYLLSLLLCLHHLTLITLGAFDLAGLLIETTLLDYIFTLLLYPVDTCITFLTSMALLYLFCYQARLSSLKQSAKVLWKPRQMMGSVASVGTSDIQSLL